MRASFPLAYPNYLIYLCLLNITKVQFWFDAMGPQAHPIFRSPLMEQIKQERLIKLGLQAVQEFDDIRQPELVTVCKKWILGQIGRLTYLELLNCFFFIRAGFARNLLNRANIHEFLETVPPAARNAVPNIIGP